MEHYITNFMLCLVVLSQYPLFIKLLLIKDNREKLLRNLLLINIFLIFVLCAYYRYAYIGVVKFIIAELLGVVIIYLIYNFVFKDKISDKIDNNYIKDKKNSIEYIEKIVERYKVTRSMFKSGSYMFIVVFFMMKSYSLNCSIYVVILSEVLLIINSITWGKAYNEFLNKLVTLKE